MNEIELREKYQLLCDRIGSILRNDRQFARRWGGLFKTFGEIDPSWDDGYSDLDTYEKILAAIAGNHDGRFQSVQNAMARARSLEETARDLLTGPQLRNRVAEIRLRLIDRTLNACFPADDEGAYRWGPCFEAVTLPQAPEAGRSYEGCARRDDGTWMCPVEGTEEGGELTEVGHFTFNSRDKATFAARHFAALYRDWLDSELGYKRIEL